MTAALLLLDLQRDFLQREPLVPTADEVVERCARLARACRAGGVPVLHVHTVVHPDGSNRMPHWKRDDYWACVEGTPGCQPSEAVAPMADELVLAKTFYSAFGNPDLEGVLRGRGAEVLVVAGVYLDACISATVFDAYQQGFTVWVASDATALPRSRAGEGPRRVLDGRAATFLTVAEITDRLALAA